MDFLAGGGAGFGAAAVEPAKEAVTNAQRRVQGARRLAAARANPAPSVYYRVYPLPPCLALGRHSKPARLRTLLPAPTRTRLRFAAASRGYSVQTFCPIYPCAMRSV
jgi:hypothetical protein